MRSLLAIVFCLLGGIATAQTPSADTKSEIAALFKALEQSNCEFNRNGSWYDAKKASEHLRKKYEYLDGKGMVTTAESFIEGAASTSSRSGKPYLVRCEGKQAVESKLWFSDKLKALRSGASTSQGAAK
jgi:hypothetical protein